jgi:hypothetical protein
MSECKHLVRTEAYRVGAGKEEPIDFFLCTWADGNPDRLIDAPRWLSYRALAGEPITQGKDCVGCPGYSPNEVRNARRA